MKRVILFLCLTGFVAAANAQSTFTDTRDGNKYKTIDVQGVTWMAENLRFKGVEGADYFENNPNNLSHYGMLYDWKTAMKVCPDGWQLPSGSDFKALIEYNESRGAWRVKKTDPNSFGIQLAGMKDYEGTYSEIDEGGYYWTSTEYDADNAEYFSFLVLTGNEVADLSRKEDLVDIHGSEKTNKYSVRCVKKQK